MSTLTRGLRTTGIRGYRRRKSMLDLNIPLNETRDEAGTSTQGVPQEVQPRQQSELMPPATIDVEAIDDDDVVESSPTAFAEAKNNAQRRTRRRPVVVDVDSGQTTRLIPNNRNKRRRVPSNQTIINCDLYINLESSGSSKENVQVHPGPPPPKEPTFSCPICMGPVVEATSTKCGHIFCKACIKAAMAVQAKCPTCRKKITVKELIRVFLPATN